MPCRRYSYIIKGQKVFHFFLLSRLQEMDFLHLKGLLTRFSVELLFMVFRVISKYFRGACKISGLFRVFFIRVISNQVFSGFSGFAGVAGHPEN